VDLPSVSARLALANDAARRSFSISPSGYGVHWILIDEDLTIDGLIASANPTQKKTEAAPLLLKEDQGQRVSSLHDHLRRVIIHVQKTSDRFRDLTVKGLHTMPIPFFGDIENAKILTVGVNPAAGEFRKNRNWPEIEPTAEYLEPRLRNYFRLADPAPHPWFSPWEESLKMLNGLSYKSHAAHLDLSPQATATIPKDGSPCEKFLEMIESDLPIFFETILLCRSAKVVLMAGAVTKRFYINEFLQKHAPRFGYELQGEFHRRPGGRMSCWHDLVSKDGHFRIPVFFFSRGPAFRKDLPELVSTVRKEICNCLDKL
jgi:uracil-DNA glycosylase